MYRWDVIKVYCDPKWCIKYDIFALSKKKKSIEYYLTPNPSIIFLCDLLMVVIHHERYWSYILTPGPENPFWESYNT